MSPSLFMSSESLQEITSSAGMVFCRFLWLVTSQTSFEMSILVNTRNDNFNKNIKTTSQLTMGIPSLTEFVAITR